MATQASDRPSQSSERHIGVVQLALDNVIRHSGASRAVVAIAGSAKTLTLVVTDDGRGLEPDEAAKAKRRGHLGMSDMRSETEAVGATLFVGKVRGSGGPDNPGAGTMIRFRWPA